MGESVRRVAVVGDDDGIRDAVVEQGGTITAPDSADAVLAVGERALVDAVDADAPILPVDAGRYAVPRSNVAAGINQLLDGDGRGVDHPLLSVTVADETAGTALLDVALVTSEPARISEYAVSFPSGRETAFRADAVTVATPLGSGGYAGASGGPVLAPGTGLSVVPVAPFTTQTDRWVTPETVTLSVERDEEPVSLVLDDETWEVVPPHTPIEVAAADDVTILSVPAARSAE